MAVKIRLARGGRKKIARYRLVATDSRCPRDGRFIETLGTYDPQADPKVFTVNVARVGHWIKQGAEVSQTVQNLLKQDRFSEKFEAIEKGLETQSLNLERKSERKRKAKPRAKDKKES